MLSNTKYLHVLLDKTALAVAEAIDAHQLKRKFPGEHVALVREAQRAEIVALDLFHEVVAVDLEFVQRSAFSPLLGDATAFSALWGTLKPLVDRKWSRVFNLVGDRLSTQVTELFDAVPVTGCVVNRDGVTCAESPLKLAHLLTDWQLGHPLLSDILLRKALNQLDLTAVERQLRVVTELKYKHPRGDLKNILAGIRLTSNNPDDTASLEFLQQIFQLVALDQTTADILRQRGHAFHDWTTVAPELELLLDLIVVDADVGQQPWSRTLNVTGRDPDELTDTIADIIPRNFTKWACLSFLFDYLGQTKLAHTCEQIIARFDKNTLAPYLHQEVLALKGFAKILLEGLRRQGLTRDNLLEDYWAGHPGTLSFIAAIELSLQPSVKPLFRSDADVMAIKNRLRSLNQFYERTHKACTLDMPVTDLALTL